MSSTCFEPKGPSSERHLYIQVWYSVFYVLKLQENKMNLNQHKLYIS